MSSNRSKLLGLVAVGAVGIGVTLAAGYYYTILLRKKRDDTDEGIGDEDSIISDSEEPSVLRDSTTPVTVAPKEQNGNQFQFPSQSVENIPEEEDASEDEIETQKKVLILGLNGSGKTALIETLTKHHDRKPHEYKPTNGFNVAQSRHGDICLNLMEVGGGEISRPYWPNFLQKTDLLVFVVDGSNRERLNEAKEALLNVLPSEELKDVPCLLLANKQDLDDAASCDEIISNNDLARISANRHLKFTMLDCVCVPGDGETDYAETLMEVIITLLQ